MTASILTRLMSPWPQWRTHWNVWHAWPLGAQVLVMSLGSLCAVVAGSLWLSAQAWDQWWHSQDLWLQTQQDMDVLQLQVNQQRARIAQLESMPHPAGFAIPAWQAWPEELAPDHREVLQAWLQWGSSHGLMVQAFKTQEGMAVGSWTGSLPPLLAAWHGLPSAVPRMAVTGFEIKTVRDPVHSSATNQPLQLQLQMQWAVLRERQHAADLLVKPQPAGKLRAELTAPVSESTPVQTMVMHRKPLSPMRHDPFSAGGLKKALPLVAQSLSTHQVSSWQTQALSELRWAGMLANAHQRLALLHADGRVHTIGVGDRLGQDWGMVTDIARDHLHLREWLADAQGKWVSQERRFPVVGKP